MRNSSHNTYNESQFYFNTKVFSFNCDLAHLLRTSNKQLEVLVTTLLLITVVD